ncbi:MAG: hypothetical protein HY290_27880 [Planctomycetia bacterium]|nr:hypothetical protein [Planctomycetia bacterium]
MIFSPRSDRLIRGIFCGLIAVAISPPATLSAADPAPADLVLRNGVVVTVDSDRPRAEALAVRATGSWPSATRPPSNR